MPDVNFPPFVPDPSYKRGSSCLSHLEEENITALVEQFKIGLPTGAFNELQVLLEVSQKQLANLIGISEATLHRRLQEGRFKKEESERLYRYVEIFRKATELFEDLAAARAWLKKPALALGNQTPLEFATTEVGAREVLHLIDRLEHGVLG